MKIYTKTGDKGQTSLVGGSRVSKDHEQIEAYGTVDELNSCIGVIAAGDGKYADFLKKIQHKLFNIGSILASEKDLGFELPEVTESDIAVLEEEIDTLTKLLPKLRNFILPGGSVLNAQTHVARCVCRRAERRVVSLANPDFELLLKYLNRLSDYLFVLSRALLHQDGVDEVIWKKDL